MSGTLPRRLISLLLSLLVILTLPISAQANQIPSTITIPELTVFHTQPLDTIDEYGGFLYGIGNGQLFRSADGGKTWTGRNRLFHIEAYDLLIVDEKVWLVGNKQGIFRSEDGGMSWERMTNDFILYGYRMLRYKDRILLVAVSNQDWKWEGSHLFESRDGGKSWSKVSKLARGAFEICTNPSQTTLYSADEKAWSISKDDGKSWSPLTTPATEVPEGAVCRPGGQGAGAAPLPEVQQPSGEAALISSLVALKDGTLLYVDESDVLYRRSPSGRWEREALPAPQFPNPNIYRPTGRRTLAAGPDGTAYISGGGHLLRSTDSGLNWERIAPPEPGVVFLNLATVTGSGRLFVATGRQTERAIYSELRTTADGGKSWSVVPDAQCVALWSSGKNVACLDGAPNRARFRLSADDGATWANWWLPKQTDFTLVTQGQFAMDGTSIYYSGSAFVPGIWRTGDSGKNWVRLTEEYGSLYSLPNNELVWRVNSELRFSEDNLATFYRFNMIDPPLRLFPAGKEIYGSSYRGGLDRLDLLPQLSDVQEHWAGRYVSRLARAGLVSGFPDGTYRPNESVSRAAALKLLISATPIGRRTDLSLPFNDVTGHWAATGGYIGGAVQAGLVLAKDFPSGSLEPDRPASRAEMARLLVRAAGLEAEVTGAISPVVFADAGEIAPEFQGYVAVAVKHGLLTGIPGADGKTYFKPLDSLTRAQAATVIYRLIARW